MTSAPDTSLSTPKQTVRGARLQRLERLLSVAGVGSAVLERAEHVRYFTGEQSGALIVGDGAGRLIADPDELPVAPSTPVGVDYPAGPFARMLRTVTTDVSAPVAALRRAKDETELEQISTAMSLVDEALAAVRAGVQVGRSDHALWSAAAEVCRRRGANLDGDIGVSPGADAPDAAPAGRTLIAGQHVFVDLYPRLDGYYGDATRVYCAGHPDAERTRIHAALWDAVHRVAEHLRPGVRCDELDRLCRESLAATGVDGGYPHHTGHGIGLCQQERPLIVPDSRDVLISGDVIAIEPGFYRRGWGAMRVEDSFAICPDGCVQLTAADRRIEADG